MAKCEEGYLCDVCGGDVGEITDSDLYLRYVIGEVDPETLHTLRERHIRCNPVLAQFIVDDGFDAAESGRRLSAETGATVAFHAADLRDVAQLVQTASGSSSRNRP